MARFEVFAYEGGYRWRLKAGNGEILAVSERYTTKDSAMRGCEAAARAAAKADIYEVTE